MNAGLWLALIGLVTVLWLNIKATKAVLRDDLSDRNQRLMQLALVWLLPVIGAVIVLAVNRPAEKASRKYRDAPEPKPDNSPVTED